MPKPIKRFKKRSLISRLRDLRKRKFEDRPTTIPKNIQGENKKWLKKYMKTGKP